MDSNQNNKNTLPSDIILKSRKELHISGVIEVVSATTSLITIKTSLGGLIIGGLDLKIKNLTATAQEVDITGDINEIKYSAKKRKLLQKVFK